MRNYRAIEKQIEMASTPIPMPKLNVNVCFVNHPAVSSIMECVFDKRGFGLQCKGSTIIFDTANLTVVDFTGGVLNKIACGTNENFINYLKLAAIEHRTFISEEKCIEVLSGKNIKPASKLIEI